MTTITLEKFAALVGTDWAAQYARTDWETAIADGPKLPTGLRWTTDGVDQFFLENSDEYIEEAYNQLDENTLENAALTAAEARAAFAKEYSGWDTPWWGIEHMARFIEADPENRLETELETGGEEFRLVWLPAVAGWNHDIDWFEFVFTDSPATRWENTGNGDTLQGGIAQVPLNGSAALVEMATVATESEVQDPADLYIQQLSEDDE